MPRARVWDVFRNSVNVVGIAVILGYVIIEARGGISLEGRAISDHVRDTLWFSLLCGLASFASIEILKRVFGLRGLFQYRQTENWLAERGVGGGGFSQLLDSMGLERDQREEATGEARRVFNLPTEQLAAQIGAAADVALASLTLERDEGAPPGPLFLAGLTGVPPETVVAYAHDRGGASDAPLGDSPRTELAARVRLGVDQLQISLSERWRRYVQGAALWISGAYGIVLVQDSPVETGAEARYVLAALVMGGLFAWVARDIAAVIERLRR
jgi:hypothetical protein